MYVKNVDFGKYDIGNAENVIMHWLRSDIDCVM